MKNEKRKMEESEGGFQFSVVINFFLGVLMLKFDKLRVCYLGDWGKREKALSVKTIRRREKHTANQASRKEELSNRNASV